MTTSLSLRTEAPTLADLLVDTRARTLLLVAPLEEADLRRQHDVLMSPILWDLGHIAHFEELWLLRNTEGPVEFVEMPGMYNPFDNPRASREELPLPGLPETLHIMGEIRARVLASFDRIASSTADVARDGYVVRMVAQHEQQHGETILQTLQLKTGDPYRAPRAHAPPPPRPVSREMVRFPGGEVEIGTDDRGAAYDNERPAHVVRLRPFLIDSTPVTNGDWLRFMHAGAYRERRWWSDEGWAWRTKENAVSPKYWTLRNGEWWQRTMDLERAVDPLRPVCHVSWHEAAAYAAWAGKRLPTEFEWEAAATWDPSRGIRHAWPWGDDPPDATVANLDQLTFDVAPIGAYPRNVSPIGCSGMTGDIWEWTASEFRGYPGFESFPYREYSEVFFGEEHRVLRGGSWATRTLVARPTFRNWDYPIRRQIFSGFRCAIDD